MGERYIFFSHSAAFLILDCNPQKRKLKHFSQFVFYNSYSGHIFFMPLTFHINHLVQRIPVCEQPQVDAILEVRGHIFIII